MSLRPTLAFHHLLYFVIVVRGQFYFLLFFSQEHPTSGMDPRMRQHIWTCLRRAAEEGVAVLMTSHSASEADAVCDKLGESEHADRWSFCRSLYEAA